MQLKELIDDLKIERIKGEVNFTEATERLDYFDFC